MLSFLQILMSSGKNYCLIYLEDNYFKLTNITLPLCLSTTPSRHISVTLDLGNMLRGQTSASISSHLVKEPHVSI